MLSKYVLRVSALGYLAILLLLPVGTIVWRTVQNGLGPVWQAVSAPDALHALQLTLVVAVIAVPLNTVFGVLAAVILVRHEFRGKFILSALLDLPLGVSPIVVGLALFVVYGRLGWFGPWLIDHGFSVIFAVPGLILATVFISLPYVAREVVPVLQEEGTDQERAAETLGASPMRTFFRITLPTIRAAVGYGIVLATARALGEFGAVSVVSGRLAGQTETLTLYVDDRFQAYDTTAAYTVSVELALISLAVVLGMSVLKRGGVKR